MRFRQFLEKALMLVLIIGVLFLAGCSSSGDNTNKEFYAGAWVLHNINNTTPASLAFDYDSAVYNFTFNLPAGDPYYFTSLSWFLDPIQSIAASSYFDVGNPIEQIFYFYVNNPVSANYTNKFNFDRSAQINYIKVNNSCLNSAYELSGQELISYSIWNSLNPELREKKKISFGGPYTPGSIMNDFGYIKLRGEILHGKNSFLYKETRKTIGCYIDGVSKEFVAYLEKPYYEIYEDNIKKYSGNLTDNFGNSPWSKSSLNYPAAADKDYYVKLFIPSYYPAFNLSIVSANFSLKHADKQPPWIENLEILPRFSSNSTLEFSFDAYDDYAVDSVKVYYKTDSWNEVDVLKNSKYYGAIIPSGNSIDLKIFVADSSGNSQQYEIYPASFQSAIPKIEELNVSKENNGVISPGDLVLISGYVRDENGNGIKSLLLDIYSGDKKIGSAISIDEKRQWDNTLINKKGYFNFNYQIPLDSLSELNISVSSHATGIFESNSFKLEKGLTRYSNDAAVLNMNVPENIKFGAENTISSTIANAGATAQNITVVFSENWYGKETRNVFLNPGESIVQSFTFIGRYWFNYYSVRAEIIGDENLENNEKYKSTYIKPLKDVQGYSYSDEGNYYINSSNITFNIENIGSQAISNINYTLGISQKNCNDAYKCSYSLIDSGFISRLGISENKRIKSLHKINETGSYFLNLSLNSPEDLNIENNFNYNYLSVFNPGPNLYLYAPYFSYNWFLGEKRAFDIEVYNNGNKNAGNISLFMYYHLGDCSHETCDFELAEKKEISQLESFGSEIVRFENTPNKTGIYVLKFAANSSDEDTDYSDNYKIKWFNIKNSGADLEIKAFLYKDLFLGMSNNISFTIGNNGNEKTVNGNYSIYYKYGYCSTECDPSCKLVCNNATLLNSQDIEIEQGNFKQYSLSFIPQSEQVVSFIVVLNASNEAYPANNRNVYVLPVKKSGPDAEIKYIGIKGELVENKNISFSPYIYNSGTETAENITVSMFVINNELFSSLFADSALITSLEPGYSFMPNLTWKASAGYYTHFFNISLDNDAVKANNQYSISSFVRKNSTDISISELYSNSMPMAYFDNTLTVKLLNRGTNAKNILVKAFSGDALINSLNVADINSGSQSYINFNWIPVQKGFHNLSAEIYLDDDTDLSNNYLQKRIFVYSPVNVSIAIKDSLNKSAKRYLIVNDFGSDYVEGEKHFIVPDLAENKISNKILSYYMPEDESSSIAVDFLLPHLEDLTLTTEFYNKTYDNGKNYYSVIFNKIPGNYSNNMFELYFPAEFYIGNGIEDLNYLSLFYCTDFNPYKRACNDYWKKANIDYWDLGSYLYIASYFNEKIEAFGVSEFSDFDGETTNFTGDLANPLILEKTLHGKIKFNQKINISRFRSDSNLLRSYVEISNKKISIISRMLPELENIPAEILFRNIDFNSPRIIYNGSECPAGICNAVNYNRQNKTLSLNVSHFSEFQVIEGFYCGDTICNNGESCSVCAADCGICQDSGTGGGGGSGSSSGGSGSKGSCKSKWDCSWGPCVNKQQKYICIDINKCVSVTNITDAKMCLIESNCIDNDNDGYGTGNDCLGFDINDNDPAVFEKTEENEAEIPGNNSLSLVVIIIWSTVLVILILLIFLIFKNHKKKDINKYSYDSSSYGY